jgi:hypothetical protein
MYRLRHVFGHFDTSAPRWLSRPIFTVAQLVSPVSPQAEMAGDDQLRRLASMSTPSCRYR